MNNSKPHILFLARWYPNRYDPMLGLFVKKHAHAICNKYKVSVLYLHAVEKGLSKTEWSIENEESLFQLLIYYPKPKNKVFYFLAFVKNYIKGLNHIRKMDKIDMIHVHILTRMGLLAYLTSFLNSIPYILTEHWSRYLPNVDTFKGWLRKKLTAVVVKKSKAVLPVTENLKRAMLLNSLLNDNYKVVPNVVEGIFFEAQTNSLFKMEKRILHVSTFENKSKNIIGIINAIGELKNNREDFKMVFVGDGMDFISMKRYASERKLDKYIEFTGLLEKEALVYEFEKASFMLINSNYENMPVVINEAFATGLPVLSTNVGGISEHLNNDRGRLIEPGQPKQLIEQINWMLDHYQEFDAAQLKAYAKAHFSMEAIGKQLSTVYQEVLVK